MSELNTNDSKVSVSRLGRANPLRFKHSTFLMLLPALTVVVILLISGMWVILWQQNQQRLTGDFAALVSEVNRDLRIGLDNQADGMSIATHPIAADATVQKALRVGDTNRLLAVWQPVFETLHRENKLTHFYFFDRNRICLLRVHAPERRGDLINRFTAMEAERTGKTASGIELGPLGTFTLRVVQPVLERGKLVGYVELGKEIEDVLQSLHNQSGIQVAVVIRKEYLKRQVWEEGMRMLGRAADWDRLQNSTVIYASQNRLPEAFASWADHFAGEHLHNETDKEIVSEGKDWRVSATPLKDASGKGVGDLLIMRDVSAEKAAFTRLKTIGGAAGIVLLSLMLGFIYVLLKRTDESIRAQQVIVQKSEEKYHLLVENINDTILVIQDGIIKFVNSRAAESFGYSEQEILSINVFDLIHPEERDVVAERYLQKINGDNAASKHAYRTITKGGLIKWVDISSVLIDWEGRPATINLITDITERRQIEETLRQSEEKYRTMLDEMENGYMELDLAGNFTFVNDETCHHTGYSREEMIGSSFRAQMDKDEFNKMYETFGKIYVTGKPERGIFYQLRRKDGTKAYIELTGLPIKNLKGEVIGFRGIAQDVTERKQAQEALKESEGLSRSYLENAPDGIYMSDLAGNFLYGNRRCEEIIGYRREELIGKNFLELNILPESSLNKAAQLLQASIDGKSTGPDEIELMNKEGRLVPVEINTNVVKRQGQIIVLAFVRDITERWRIAAVLREREAQYRLLADHMRDAIWLIDMNLKTIYVSPSTQKWRGMGYTLSELMELPLDQNITPVSLELAMEAFAEEMPKATEDSTYSFVRTLELEFYRKDGTTFWSETTFSLIRDENGNPMYFLGESRDITERKQAEDALKQTNIQLEDAIGNANQMTIKAELANIAKSDFLANMSHEIRTPMNGVMGMTSLLLETELSDEQRKYAGIVKASGESLLGILNDILDFSKMEAGKMEIEILDFDLHALLDDFAAVLALRAQDKGLEFICAAAPDVPAYLKGDPGRLRQILTNMTGNAVKFTHQGEIAVRVRLLTETDTDAVVRFSVKDTGIGIPENKQALMFQKFTQADTSTTRKYGGTGLGLAISKQLVELMGGEIGIVSKGGHGSEFWFTVRLGKQAQRERDVAPTADIRDLHVLVVDDNATNREILMTQFAAWGVRGEEAPDGDEALKSLYRACEKGDPFRIAILDMQMPGMDGAQLASAIKADEKIKDTSLVLLTSLGQRGEAKKMEQIGFSAYLTKPTRQSEMFACLAAVLTGSALPQSLQSLVTRHSIREMNWSGVRILLAEDNLVNQQVAIGILKKLGLRADIAANGAEALKALETIPYDLVLMDIQMPVMNGIDATKQIRNPRSAVRNHEIPIIAMTANAMQGDREKCLKAGMNDYVSKPVSPKALAEALEKWLPKKEDEYPMKDKDESPMSNTQYPTDDVGRVTSRGDENKSLDIGNSQIPVFDKAGLMERVMDDEDLAQNLIEVFLDDIPTQIEILRGHLEAGDISGAEHQSHTIKGASANVGGEALRAVAFEMEKTAKAGNLEAVRSLLPEMVSHFGRLKDELRKGKAEA